MGTMNNFRAEDMPSKSKKDDAKPVTEKEDDTKTEAPKKDAPKKTSEVKDKPKAPAAKPAAKTAEDKKNK